MLPTKLVTTAMSFGGLKKNNFWSFIYGQSSTNPADFMKIGLVDVELVGLTEITKNIKNKTSAEHKPSSPAHPAERVGQ